MGSVTQKARPTSAYRPEEPTIPQSRCARIQAGLRPTASAHLFNIAMRARVHIRQPKCSGFSREPPDGFDRCWPTWIWLPWRALDRGSRRLHGNCKLCLYSTRKCCYVDTHASSGTTHRRLHDLAASPNYWPGLRLTHLCGAQGPGVSLHCRRKFRRAALC